MLVITTSWILLFLLTTLVSIQANVVSPKCAKQSKSCHFNFIISSKTTMMSYPDGEQGRMTPVYVDKHGNWVQRGNNISTCEDLFPLSELDKKTIIIGDGSRVDVKVVNGQLPGTPIVVFEDQTVIVNIANQLINDVVTIHWHGLHQRGTNAMDGVAKITQCPIIRETSFTYRFKASPSGTHWYHAHAGTLRTRGLYGPLIILPATDEREHLLRGNDQLPKFDNDFYMMLQEWTEKDSENIVLDMNHGAERYFYGYDKKKCYHATKGVDGLNSGLFPFQSVVINGKGRRYNSTTQEAENPGVPLEVFEVENGGIYRFRLINTGMSSTFRVSVDNHLLNIIASDGSDVMTKQVESVIIANGERYDFWINADDPKKIGNYWIRVNSLDRTQYGKVVHSLHAEAILRYKAAVAMDPQSNRQSCSVISPCHILNCPYREYPEDEHMVCIPVTDLRRTLDSPTWKSHPEQLSEYIFNLNYAKYRTSSGDYIKKPAINGMITTFPRHGPVLLDPDTPLENQCDYPYCPKELCECANVVSLNSGSTVQMTFSSAGEPHSYHIHGNYLQVLKIGWPNYDPRTKIFQNRSDDITCEDQHCNHLIWTNSKWQGGRIPGLLQTGAPLKDTIIVPAGGYVVTRLRADNPGIWFSHCHMEFHNENGMALFFKVGNSSDIPRPPKNIQTCGDFDFDPEDESSDNLEKTGKTQSKNYQSHISLKNTNLQAKDQLSNQQRPFSHKQSREEFYQTMSIILGVTVLCLLLVNVYLVIGKFKHKKRTLTHISDESIEHTPLLS